MATSPYVEYNLPSLTLVGYRNSQATRVRDIVTQNKLKFLDLNSNANAFDTSALRFPIINATRFIGASPQDDLLSATIPAAVSGYPPNYYLMETTGHEKQLGNYTQYFYDDGFSFNIPPSQWVADFFAASDKMPLLYQGCSYKDIFDEITGDYLGTDGIPTPAIGLYSGKTQVLLSVTADVPSTPVYDAEEHRTRPQLCHSIVPAGFTTFNTYPVAGFSGSWSFGSQYLFATDSPIDFWWVPVYDADKNTIVDGKPIPDCRLNHEIDLGWDYTEQDSDYAYFAHTCVVCWNDILAIVPPNIIFAEYDPWLEDVFPVVPNGTQIRIQWKPLPEWQLLSGDNDPDAPSIFHEGFIRQDEVNDTGWTTFAYMTVDGDGAINTTPVVIAGTQPAIGDLVMLRVAYEDTGLSYDGILGYTMNTSLVFNWAPTRLPFATRTTSGLLPGHG